MGAREVGFGQIKITGQGGKIYGLGWTFACRRCDGRRLPASSSRRCDRRVRVLFRLGPPMLNAALVVSLSIESSPFVVVVDGETLLRLMRRRFSAPSTPGSAPALIAGRRSFVTARRLFDVRFHSALPRRSNRSGDGASSTISPPLPSNSFVEAFAAIRSKRRSFHGAFRRRSHIAYSAHFRSDGVSFLFSLMFVTLILTPRLAE